jgi:RecA/RadA recombinase/predicted flap endonuclease-1-like 5' DNA nuclease
MSKKSKENVPEENLTINDEDRKAEKPTENKGPTEMKKDLGKVAPKELTDLMGIGPKAAEKLRELCGISDMEELATSRPDEIAAQMKVTFTVAKGWVSQAQEALLPTMELTSAVQEEAYKNARVLQFKTGSPKFNAILGGGVTTMAITGTSGRLASGKSVIGEDIIIDAIHNHFCCPKDGRKLSKNEKCPECGNLAKPVEAVMIETEPDTFHLSRLQDMAKAKKYMDMDWSRLIVVGARKVATIKSQFLWYKAIKHAIDSGRNIRLVVIDSFNAKIRAGWSKSEMLPVRSRELAEHFNLMEWMAARYNLAWYITCQVIAPPRPDQGLGAKVKFTDTYYPVGGDTLLHSVNQWVALTQVKSGMWTAQIFDSSYLPRNEANFIIDKSGLLDAVE